MKQGVVVCLTVLSLLAVSCKTSAVKGYWSKHTPDIADIRAAEEEFVQFAELASAAPGQDARAEIDRLFRQLRSDEVLYYVYTEWIVRAFYSTTSPCRNCELFIYSMQHVLEDGIVDGYDAELYAQFVTACQTNRVGDVFRLPSLSDRSGNDVTIDKGQAILFLVVDLSCPSCLRALEIMSETYPEARHVALCKGPGGFPKMDGWEFYRTYDTESVYDISAAPFYFFVNADGVVEETYTRAL